MGMFYLPIRNLSPSTDSEEVHPIVTLSGSAIPDGILFTPVSENSPHSQLLAKLIPPVKSYGVGYITLYVVIRHLNDGAGVIAPHVDVCFFLREISR